MKAVAKNISASQSSWCKLPSVMTTQANTKAKAPAPVTTTGGVAGGIPHCIHIRLGGARPFTVLEEFILCFDCHDLFASWERFIAMHGSPRFLRG